MRSHPSGGARYAANRRTQARATTLAAALVATAALLVSGCSGDEYVAPPAKVRTSDVADPTVAAQTLTSLQRAVRAGDADAASALGAGTGADLLAALARNAQRAHLSDVSFTYITETGRTDGAHAWDGVVGVTWRARGFDVASARTEVPFSFADDGRAITAIGGPNDRMPVWLTGPLDVRRTDDVLVMAAGAKSRAVAYQRRAQQAVTRVRAVLGTRGGLVVEVPADQGELDRALDVDDGTYAAIAAITAPVDGSLAKGSPVHVFINPAVYDGLDSVAAQVVMTHEAVHALTDAPRARKAPLWLVEGFADYVALRDVGLPLSKSAGQLIKQVRQQGAPKALPSDADFDPTTPHLGTVYEAAWQVTQTLADHGGEAALVDLYRAVLTGTPLDDALQQGFGWSVADLTRAWQARLTDLR